MFIMKLPSLVEQKIVESLSQDVQIIYQFVCKQWREWLLPTIPLDMQGSDLCNVCAVNGYISLLQYIEIRKHKHACSVAAYYGQLECLKHLHENGYHDDGMVIAQAAGRGNIQCLKYAVQNGFKDEYKVRNKTKKNTEWNYYVAIPHYCPSALHMAVAGGNMECIQYIMENSETIKPLDFEMRATLTAVAARHENLECLKYLHKHGCSITHFTLTRAVNEGSAGCVKYILDTGIESEINPVVLYKAIEYNLLDTLKYLHIEKGLKITPQAIDACGGIECLHYLHHELKLPFTPRFMYNAVKKNLLDCLKYAVAESYFDFGGLSRFGSPYNIQRDTLEYLDNNNLLPKIEKMLRGSNNEDLVQLNLPCIKYLLEVKGWTLPINASNISTAAGTEGDIEYIKYLHKFGWWNDGKNLVQQLVYWGKMDALKWALKTFPNAATPENYTHAMEGNKFSSALVLAQHHIPMDIETLFQGEDEISNIGFWKMAQRKGKIFEEKYLHPEKIRKIRYFRFFIDGGTPCSVSTLRKFVENKNFKLFYYALKMGIYCPSELKELAANSK